MLSLSLLVLLAAPTPTVLVLPEGPGGGQLRQDFERALRTARVIDGHAAYGALFPPPAEAAGFFKGFTQPAPEDWPAALAPSWAAAMQTCRDLAGPKPWPRALNPKLSACATQLADQLWAQYLEHHHAERVFVFDIQVDKKGGTVTVTATTYRPDEAEQRAVSETVPTAELSEVVTRSVQLLVAGHGAIVRRSLVQVPTSKPRP